MNKMDAILEQAKTSGPRLIPATPLTDAAGDLLDLARNVGGFDDGILTCADLKVIRGALWEWRDQARAALDKAEGRSP